MKLPIWLLSVVTLCLIHVTRTLQHLDYFLLPSYLLLLNFLGEVYDFVLGLILGKVNPCVYQNWQVLLFWNYLKLVLVDPTYCFSWLWILSLYFKMIFARFFTYKQAHWVHLLHLVVCLFSSTATSSYLFSCSLNLFNFL